MTRRKFTRTIYALLGTLCLTSAVGGLGCEFSAPGKTAMKEYQRYSKSGPKQTKEWKQLQREQDLIKQENSLRKQLIEAAGDEKASLEQELVKVSAELDQIDRIKETKAAPRRAREAKAAAEKAAERRAMGYMEGDEHKRTAEAAIRDAGLSCPEVRSLRMMGDKGRGPVIRAHCTNNVFFLITISPDGKRHSVKIMD